MREVYQDFGQVILSKQLPDPSKCRVTSRGLNEAVVEEESMAVIGVINFAGESCNVPFASLECEFTGTRAYCTEEKIGSKYKIRYQPTVKERHWLHVKAEGQHIRGSPYTVAVKTPIEKLGTPILSIRGIRKPWGCAINWKREIFVTDMVAHCIAVFTPGEQKLRSFGTHGSGPGQLDHPCGLTLDGEGNVLVADSWNHCIQKFTAQGEFLATVGAEGSGYLQFAFLSDIAFNVRNKKFYVVDRENNRIQVLNSNLNNVDSFGTRGSDSGCLHHPHSISIDSSGNV